MQSDAKGEVQSRIGDLGAGPLLAYNSPCMKKLYGGNHRSNQSNQTAYLHIFVGEVGVLQEAA